jgi:hypothetical protein
MVGPLRVGGGGDELLSAGGPPRRHERPPPLPLGQELRVHRAGVILVETVLERVLEMVEVEHLRAPLVRPVQERAVKVLGVWHFSIPRRKLQRDLSATTSENDQTLAGKVMGATEYVMPI